MANQTIPERMRASAKRAIKPALKTTRFLATIIVPVSLVVALMDWSGVIRYIAHYLAPVMGLFGLPGESALVFISSVLLNIYSAIAVIATLNMGPRAVTIIALMCLVSHNMIVETAVMKKTGTPAWVSVTLRLFMSLLAGFAINLVLPGEKSFHLASGDITSPIALPAATALVPLFRGWAITTVFLLLKIAVIVIVLMVLVKILEEFKVLDILSLIFKPVVVFFGLPESTSFLWIVANTLGLAYGAAIMIDLHDSGALSAKDGDLFNRHVAVCHSLLEDTLLFVAIGVGAFWIIVPRLFLALLCVWGERLRRIMFRRSFEVGTL
jgi:hypothetical protein